MREISPLWAELPELAERIFHTGNAITAWCQSVIIKDRLVWGVLGKFY